MKYILLIITSMLFSIEVISQQFHFKLDKSIENELIDVVETDSTYEFVGHQFTLNNRKPYYLRLSKTGAFLFDSAYVSQDPSIFGGMAFNSSNRFFVSVPVTKPSSMNSIMHFNATKSNFYIEFNDTTKDLVIENLKIINDSLLIGIGAYFDSIRYRNTALWIFNLNDTSQLLIDLKDSSSSQSPIKFAFDIISYKDGFLVSAFGLSSGGVNTWGASSEIIVLNRRFQVDTIFDISHSANTFGNRFVGYFVSLLNIDDNYFMTTSVSANPRSATHSKSDDIVAIVMDSSFNEVSLNFYGLRDSTAEEANESLSRFENNPYVYIGGTENYKVDFSGYPSDTTLFILTKADLMGNEIWTRYYSNNTNLFMRKVLATSDGGALMVGWSYDPAGPDGFEKDVWIVKVDSNGNYLPTSIKEQQISKSDFNFYPNPLTNELHFRQINTLRNYQFELFDVSGRKVAEEQLINSDETINTSHLKTGTYIYHLMDQNGNYATGKLIRE